MSMSGKASGFAQGSTFQDETGTVGRGNDGSSAKKRKNECKQAALYAQLRWLGFGRHSDRLFCLILRGKYLQDQIRKVY